MIPFETIEYALTKCESGRGDVIKLAPGTYEENVVIEGIDYVTIEGYEDIGGYGRPDIVPATGIAIDVVTSQGVVLRALRAASADDHVLRCDSNGFKFYDLVLDGDGNGATDAGLLLKGNADDDSYTASEGHVRDVLIRGSGGYGLALDTGDAPGNGVGVTHGLFERIRFIGNTGIDLIALDSGGGTYAVQTSVFRELEFMSRNKATHLDIETNLGATNTGNLFRQCFFLDDTINTTAIKAAGTGSGFVGCYGLDGVIDGDALD